MEENKTLELKYQELKDRHTSLTKQMKFTSILYLISIAPIFIFLFKSTFCGIWYWQNIIIW